jgi:hypothetical protein
MIQLPRRKALLQDAAPRQARVLLHVTQSQHGTMAKIKKLIALYQEIVESSSKKKKKRL